MVRPCRRSGGAATWLRIRVRDPWFYVAAARTAERRADPYHRDVVIREARRVVVVGYDRCELLDIACVTSALDVANRLGATPAYEVVLATLRGASIRCDSGLEVTAQAQLERVDPVLDTLVVSGGLGHVEAAADVHLRQHVRRLAATARRVSSVCTGASVLAAAELLNGRRATTH